MVLSDPEPPDEHMEMFPVMVTSSWWTNQERQSPKELSRTFGFHVCLLLLRQKSDNVAQSGLQLLPSAGISVMYCYTQLSTLTFEPRQSPLVTPMVGYPWHCMPQVWGWGWSRVTLWEPFALIGVVAHICNLRTQEALTGALWVWS